MAKAKEAKAEYQINPIIVIINLISNMFFGLAGAVVNFVILIMITNHLGDEANGIFQSTLSLLSYIVLAEAGVGAIYRQKMYKYFVDKDYKGLNNVLANYRRVNKLLLVPYVILVLLIATVFPLTITSSFTYGFILLMVLLNGLKRLFHLTKTAPYELTVYVGEKDYAIRYLNFFTELFSLGAIYAVVFLATDFNIETKLMFTVGVYTFKAFLMSYVSLHVGKKSFDWIDPKAKITEKISLSDVKYQFVHSIAGVIVNSTDTITISIMLGLVQTSIYSAYLAVNIGVKSIMNQALAIFGSIIGKSSTASGVTKEKMNLTGSLTISISSFATVCLAILSVPFVTFFFQPEYKNFNVAVLFAVYSGVGMMIGVNNSYYEATGHFKGTMVYSLIEAVANISLSIFFVILFNDIYAVLLATVITSLFKYFSVLIYVSRKVAVDKASTIITSTLRTIFAAFLPSAIILGVWVNIEHMFDFKDLMHLAFVFVAVPAAAGIGIFISSMIFDNKSFRSFLNYVPYINRWFGIKK